MSHPTSCTAPALAVALTAMLLAACGKDDSGVAVRVNAGEITVRQVSGELARLRGLDEEQRKSVAKQMLDRLVDQELLVQRALDLKLDRDPRVIQAVEASRRQVLAQAYLDSITAQAARPLPAEVARFYAGHPELFAERKIYRLQELAIAARPDLSLARVEQELRKAASLNDVVEWLKREKIAFSANSSVKAAEQLPMDVLPRLTVLQPGQAMLVPASQGYLVVQMAAAELQPLTDEQARPFIEQYLANQYRRELAQAELSALRRGARIEYLGDFSPGAIAPRSHTLQVSTPLGTKE